MRASKRRQTRKWSRQMAFGAEVVHYLDNKLDFSMHYSSDHLHSFGVLGKESLRRIALCGQWKQTVR